MAVRKKKATKKAASKSAAKKPALTSKAGTGPISAMRLLGKPAPAFTMPTDDGGTLALAGLKGKRVVLYFYPKDDTPGCTTEACAFRDDVPAFGRTNAVVIGVSKDSVKSHQKFKAKYGLNFTLASAENTDVCERYGVWVMKSMYGRKYMGIERSTFVIDEKGIVRNEWRKVSVTGHADDVRNALAAL